MTRADGAVSASQMLIEKYYLIDKNAPGHRKPNEEKYILEADAEVEVFPRQQVFLDVIHSQ